MVQQSQHLLNSIFEKDSKVNSARSNQTSPRMKNELLESGVSSDKAKKSKLRNYKSHEKFQTTIINNFFTTKLEEVKMEYEMKNKSVVPSPHRQSTLMTPE